MATVNKIGENTYDFTLDDGTRLWVAAPAYLNLNPKYERAIIDYTILSDKQGDYDHYIKLNRYSDLLTKNPIYIAADDKKKQDSIGYNPIKVHSVWTGGGYLNISFGYNVGGTESHMLNLVSAEADLGANEDVVKLEFRHNAYNDPELYGANGYVSFNLSPYRIEGREKVTLEISAKDFNGEPKIYKTEYKYKNSGTEPENSIIDDDYNTTNLNIY